MQSPRSAMSQLALRTSQSSVGNAAASISACVLHLLYPGLYWICVQLHRQDQHQLGHHIHGQPHSLKSNIITWETSSLTTKIEKQSIFILFIIIYINTLISLLILGCFNHILFYPSNHDLLV